MLIGQTSFADESNDNDDDWWQDFSNALDNGDFSVNIYSSEADVEQFWADNPEFSPIYDGDLLTTEERDEHAAGGSIDDYAYIGTVNGTDFFQYANGIDFGNSFTNRTDDTSTQIQSESFPTDYPDIDYGNNQIEYDDGGGGANSTQTEALDIKNIDTFDSNIIYGKTEGDVVKILSEDGTYKIPSELNPDSAIDRKSIHEFAASLARGLDGMNKKIYISSIKDSKLSSQNPAFTRHPTTVGSVNYANIIYLTTNGGYSKDLDNVNNFKSILKHEILHADDNNNNVTSNLSTHVDVYIKAMKHITFGQTNRDDFQIGIINSLKNYILNMDKRTDTKTIYYPYHIKQKIDDFNNIAGLDFTFFVVDSPYNTKGTLNIEIRDRLNGNAPLPELPYEKISDEN